MTSDSGSATQADLDLAHLARQTGGDRPLEQEVLSLFRDQCRRQIGVIKAAGLGRAARDAAHTLIGAARGIGAFRIAAIAERLEQASTSDAFAAALADLDPAIRDAGALIDQRLADA